MDPVSLQEPLSNCAFGISPVVWLHLYNPMFASGSIHHTINLWSIPRYTYQYSKLALSLTPKRGIQFCIGLHLIASSLEAISLSLVLPVQTLFLSGQNLTRSATFEVSSDTNHLSLQWIHDMHLWLNHLYYFIQRKKYGQICQLVPSFWLLASHCGRYSLLWATDRMCCT